jgi:hypothetical protein
MAYRLEFVTKTGSIETLTFATAVLAEAYGRTVPEIRSLTEVGCDEELTDKVQSLKPGSKSRSAKSESAWRLAFKTELSYEQAVAAKKEAAKQRAEERAVDRMLKTNKVAKPRAAKKAPAETLTKEELETLLVGMRAEYARYKETLRKAG